MSARCLAGIRVLDLSQYLPGPEPRIEVAFPALFDGVLPVPRVPLQERAAEDLLAAWGGG